MDKSREQQFVQSLTSCQGGLYAYILVLLPNHHAAEDVLQETNVTLWDNAERYQPGTDFMAWACRVAYFQVLTYRKKRSRSRLLFSDAMLQAVAEHIDRHAGELPERLSALRQCMSSLPERQQKILEQRYMGSGSVSAIADRWGMPVKTIYQNLYRLRRALAECIQRRLSPDTGGEA